MRRLAEMLLLLIFPLLLVTSGLFLIFTANNFWLNCFCLYFYLFGRFKSLKGKILSDWIRKLDKNEHFRDWKRQCKKVSKMELCFQLDTTFVQEFQNRKQAKIWLATTTIQIRKTNSDWLNAHIRVECTLSANQKSFNFQLSYRQLLPLSALNTLISI